MTDERRCNGPECKQVVPLNYPAHLSTLEKASLLDWMKLEVAIDAFHFCDIECLFKWAYYEGGFDKACPNAKIDK